MAKNIFRIQKKFLYSSDTFSESTLQWDSKKRFYCPDFCKNKLVAKQDQNPISGKVEFFGKREVWAYLGSRIMERDFLDSRQSPAP